MPVVTVGAEHATRDAPLITLEGNALDLRGETVADCGHFITEECHEAFIELIVPFLSEGNDRPLDKHIADFWLHHRARRNRRR